MDDQPKSRGGPGRGQGRKPLDPSDQTLPVTIKMTGGQKEKMLRLGGAAWVRARIDKAREPGPKE